MKNPITLQPGKYYRTRDGRKAYCLGVDPLCENVPESHKLPGYEPVLEMCVDKTKYYVSCDGKWFGDLSIRQENLDIVDEWTEE